jgi:hypothetical protein
MEKEQKLDVLKKVCLVLEKNKIEYCIGASLLLYFNGLVSDFHDLDFEIKEEDADKIISLLSPLGTFEERTPNPNYKTHRFLEFNIAGVELDFIGGFIIVREGKDYPCFFTNHSIGSVTYLDKVPIYLGRLEDWEVFYLLMGRKEKYEIIKNYFAALSEAKDSK